MNTWDVVIILAVVAAVGFALRRVVRNRKGGGCGCGCEGCAMKCDKRR